MRKRPERDSVWPRMPVPEGIGRSASVIPCCALTHNLSHTMPCTDPWAATDFLALAKAVALTAGQASNRLSGPGPDPAFTPLPPPARVVHIACRPTDMPTTMFCDVHVRRFVVCLLLCLVGIMPGIMHCFCAPTLPDMVQPSLLGHLSCVHGCSWGPAPGEVVVE